MVIYGVLFGGIHSVIFISMIYIEIEMFHESVIDPNATMVVCGVLFGGIHPVVFISRMCI